MTQEEQLLNYAAGVLGHDASGHSLDHIRRVVATTKTLLAQTPAADPIVAVAAAALHDTYDDKLVPDVAAAKARTVAAMTAAGLTARQRQAILAIIDHMSFKASLAGKQALSLEGQLVQDADRLDAIGAIGIARAMMYGGAHGSKLYDPALTPREHLDAAAYRGADSTIINHFHEKLLKLAAQMNTPAAKRMATNRHQVMTDYLAEFAAEWRGEK
ncbi:HD domain-containing protein [Lacticaseibacillus jixianensis]|uniref:HD domain-containing protein n=1 Tax=Lacticaseibacillus jixianensis TaxID=2486012 RepID=A0ABW4BA94_9LACO|nr:HD domain-containing protein [Lacticaseibacillus jixianensis]